MTTTCKLRSERHGEHVTTAVFMGPKNQTLAHCGTLVHRLGEWQLFGAALLLGAEQTKGHLEVVCTGYLSGAAMEEEQSDAPIT